MDSASKDLPIIFFGTPSFASIQLERLMEHGYRVVAAVTAPDKPAGRGLRMKYSEVKEVALKHNLPLLQPESLKDPVFLQSLQSLKAQLFIVIAFRMLPEVVWKMPPLETFNVHASLLPDYRGAAPINWAIINGETETGLTTFLLNERIDEGNIIFQHKMKISPDETAGALHDRMAEEAWPLICQTLDAIQSGKVLFKPQDNNLAVHKAPKITREHLRINWHNSLSGIKNQIRGLSPKPGAYTELIHLSGKKDEMRILRASLASEEYFNEPYTLFVRNKQLFISHPEGLLRLEEVQLKGKNVLNANEFIKGFRDDGGWKVE